MTSPASATPGASTLATAAGITMTSATGHVRGNAETVSTALQKSNFFLFLSFFKFLCPFQTTPPPLASVTLAALTLATAAETTQRCAETSLIRTVRMHHHHFSALSNLLHTLAKAGSCSERCGNAADPDTVYTSFDCYCDAQCDRFGDCCPDFDQCGLDDEQCPQSGNFNKCREMKLNNI